MPSKIGLILSVILVSSELAFGQNKETPSALPKTKTPQVEEKKSEESTPPPKEPRSGIVVFGTNPRDLSHGANVFVGWDNADRFHYSSNNISYSYRSRGAALVGARYAWMRERDVGFMLGAQYEFDRRLEELTTSGVTVSLNDPLQLSLIVVEGNATLTFSQFYFFGGLNYTHPIKTGGAPEPGVKYYGGLGLQAGVGVKPFQSGLIGEILLQSHSIRQESQTDNIVWNFSGLVTRLGFIID